MCGEHRLDSCRRGHSQLGDIVFVQEHLGDLGQQGRPGRNGRISFFGGLPKTDPTITCDSNTLHYRQLHIHGANGSAPEHNKRAPQYISTGQVPVEDLIRRHISLNDVLDAFQIVKSGEAIKVTVEPSAES